MGGIALAGMHTLSGTSTCGLPPPSSLAATHTGVSKGKAARVETIQGPTKEPYSLIRGKLGIARLRKEEEKH